MNRNKKVILTMRSSVRTLSIKCYDEQMPDGWDAVKQHIKSIDKSKWQVIGICHDRDYNVDDYWEPSVEKPHYHIIVRVLNGKNARVEQILRTIGIVYRPVEDKSLWENHGVESCADYTNMAVYLTHETEQAILDGKEQYRLDELVSNLSLEEIKQIREGYARVSNSTEKVTPRMMAKLDEDAYELGRKIGNFDAWYRALPFSVRKNAGMKTIKESYEMGKSERLEELQEGAKIPRLCVYIQGEPGLGKSYAAKYAMQKLGQKFLPIGEGTGKFDKLKETHGAIIIDDTQCPNLLQMADTSITDAHKRCNGNPLWVGEYLIVTNNDPFEDWLDECGFRSVKKMQAAKDRFYVCHLGKVEGSGRYVLECISPAQRGDDELSQEIDDRYIAFRDYYNESLAEYHSKRRKRDISSRLHDLNGYIATPEEIAAYNAKRDEEKEKREAAERAEEERKRKEKEKKSPEEYAELHKKYLMVMKKQGKGIEDFFSLID